jgi:hypothetical protein
MVRPVIITTPIPTWDETVRRLGLSKADQRFVKSLFEEKSSRRSTAYAFKARAGSSGKTKPETKRASGIARKTRSRARKAA